MIFFKFVLLSLIFKYMQASSLQLVTAIFRHGQKTNIPETTYPKDPYINETYFPYGLGQLTNEGKRTEYNLGKLLRERYGNFLGTLYLPNKVNALSTDTDRTQESLQLLLSNLFPPKNTTLEWNRLLNFNPIPYRYVELSESPILWFPKRNCPNYQKLFENYQKSTPAQDVENKYKDKYPYISYHTGWNITSLDYLYILYFGLEAEINYNLSLPKWTEEIYPDYLKSAVKDYYLTSAATINLKKLSGGFLLKKIIENITQEINNELPTNSKIFLYSAHEYNVAFILAAMNVLKPLIPSPGSMVIIELHKIEEEHFVKLFYNEPSFIEPKELKVPNCEAFCSFTKFRELLKDNIPENYRLCTTDNFK